MPEIVRDSTRPRPLIAAVLSAAVPGLGQLYAGRRRRGYVLLAVSALVIVALGVAAGNPSRLLKLAFDPEVLTALLVVNALVFLFRVIVAVDAYLLCGHDRVPLWLWSTVVSLVGVVLLAPHALFAYYDAVQYDLITTVFAEPTTTTVATTTTTTTTTISAQPVGSTATTTSTRAPDTTTTTEPPPVWGELDRLNVLLLGGDSGVGRTGVRTDTMILASIDVDTGELALISVPRNFARVPLPEEVGIWSCDCFPPILNELYQYGENRPDAFPGSATPGANAIKGAVAELTGLPVHFYALVALDGFVDMVDALGGVTINVTERVYDSRYPSEGGGTEVIDFKPGTHEFDGHDALAYARSRRGSSDYDRMGRQRCVIEAVVDQADPFSLLRSFPVLAEVIKASVETDIPLAMMPDLIDLLPLVDTEEALSLRLVPPTYVGGWTDDGYNIPDVELIQEHVQLATTLPRAEAMAAIGIDPVADGCG